MSTTGLSSNTRTAIFVIESTEQDVKVKVMHQAGQLSWKWPEKDDCIYYVPSDIMKVIEPPMITSTMEHSGTPEQPIREAINWRIRSIFPAL